MTSSVLPPALAPMMRLGRYELRAKIADGGMASIWAGRVIGPPPPGLRDPHGVVALKVIRDDLALNRDFVNMFLDEAQIVSRMSHPSVVQHYEMGVEGRRVFIAMELLRGESLWYVWDACREKKVRLRYDMIAWIGARVAEGLHYAHEMIDASGQPLHIVHRDVNATNVFVTFDGQVKVIDFGLAKAVNRVSKTQIGVIKGKVAYMAPEQATGAPVDRRTDVFALATMLWELAADRRLFKHKEDIDTLKAVHAAEIPDPTQLVYGFPPALWQVLKRGLARQPEARYQTALEMARELDALALTEGRRVDAAACAHVMHMLFPEDRDRQARWVAEASAADRPAPQETLKPPSVRESVYPNVIGRGGGAQPSAPPPSQFWSSGEWDANFSPPSRRPQSIVPEDPPRQPSAPRQDGSRVPVGAFIAILVAVLTMLGIGALVLYKMRH